MSSAAGARRSGIGGGYRFGPFTLEGPKARLRHGARVVPLRGKTLRVLDYLVARAGRLVPKEDLRAGVWSGLHVSDMVVSVCVSELRKALGDTQRPARFIATVHGRGFRFVAPVEVIRTTPAASEARRARAEKGEAPPVGREHELAELRRRLVRADRGERQVVLVSGDAGMGKTRLVQALLDEATRRHEIWVGVGQCEPQHGPSEPFMPVLQALERLAQSAAGSTLVPLLRQHAPSWLAQIAHETQRSERAPAPPVSSAGRMLREMITGIEAVSREHLMVIVLEDVHWSDASTVDLIGAIARRAAPARLLIIATYRPVEVVLSDHPFKLLQQDLRAGRLCVDLRLEPLSEAAVATYLTRRMSGAAPRPALVRSLHRHTAGNPFFLEHLTRRLADEGMLAAPGGRIVAAEDVRRALRTLPTGLRQMIADILRRVPAADAALLEAAAVAGFEFAAAAVAAALGREPMAVEEACARLGREGRILAEAGTCEWQDGTVSGLYRFVHPMYREVLYEALASARRRAFHGRIGERLEKAHGSAAADIAGELAVHFAGAGGGSRAVHYHDVAAARASRQGAFAEAIEHLRAALANLVRLRVAKRAEKELSLLVRLAPLLLNARGFDEPEVHEVYRRALHLAGRCADAESLVLVLQGLEWIHRVRGDLDEARRAAERMLAAARRSGAPNLLVEAHHTMGSNRFRMSDFRVARRHLEQVAKGRTPRARADAYLRSGHDAVSCSLAQLGTILWLTGSPEQAVDRARQAVARGDGLAHPPSMALVYVIAAWTHVFRHEGGEVLRLASLAVALAREHLLPFWEAVAMMMQGWAQVDLGRSRAGLALLRDGFALYEASGGAASTVDYHVLLASAFERVGDHAAGLRSLDVAFYVLRRHQQRYFEAELHRLKGELLCRAEASRVGEAELCFRRALTVARKQGARSLELRAAISLARHCPEGRKTAALESLAALLRQFDEGHDTADLRQAAAMIAAPPGVRSRSRRA